MSSAYVTALVPQIKGILQTSDLSTVSAKAVRKKLIASGHEETVIKENRKEIDAKIAEIYEKLTANVDLGPAGGSSPEPSRGHARSSIEHPSSLPEPLRVPKVEREVKDEPVDIKPKAEPRSRPVPSMTTVAETDEEMAARLQREFNAEGSGGRASRSGGAVRKVKKKVIRVKKRKTDDGSDEEDRPKKKRGGGGGAFNKELILSDALAALLGESQLSRPQVVKRIWAYVKERGLQDETDKRYIVCDEGLRNVFHSDRIHMFTMNKILVDHVRDPDEIAFKDENGATPVKREVKPAPAPTPIKHDPHALSQATVEDSDDEDDFVNGHDSESDMVEAYSDED